MTLLYLCSYNTEYIYVCLFSGSLCVYESDMFKIHFLKKRSFFLKDKINIWS